MSNYKSYFLKSMGLREDNLPGGKGDESQPNQVDQEQLQMGIKVEMEHTQDEALAKEIAMDHLSEDPQYYSHLKSAGMADELPNGQQPPNQPPMQMQKLMSPAQKPMGVSPTAIMPTPVIGVAVRGSSTGGFPGGGEINTSEKSRLGGLEPLKVLPKGGAVGDTEKARLGGLELVKNPKANSQGAFANTPSSDALKADGGHYTPDNKDISKGQGPATSKKGDDAEHPMQFQKMGNPPPKDDGTGRDGTGLKPSEEKPVEPHPMSGPIAGPEGGTGEEKDLSKAGIDDKPEAEEEEPKKGPWGIGLDDEDDEEEGEDVSVDIKETLKEALGTLAPAPAPAPVVAKECSTCGCGNPADDHGMKDRFQQLANIKKEGWAQGGYTPEQEQSIAKLSKAGYREASTFPAQPDADNQNQGDTVVVVLQKKSRIGSYSCEVEPDGTCNGQPVDQFISGNMREAGALSQESAIKQLEELVGRLNAKGTVTPTLPVAQKYLAELKNRRK